MKKVSFILSIFLFLGCSSKKEHNSNFSMDQIEQLQLSNVKPINILDKVYITIEKYTIFQLKSIPVLIVCEDKKSYLNAG